MATLHPTGYNNGSYKACRPSDGQFLGYFFIHSSGESYSFDPLKGLVFFEGDMFTIQKSLVELNQKLRTEKDKTKETDNLHQTVANLISRVKHLERLVLISIGYIDISGNLK